MGANDVSLMLDLDTKVEVRPYRTYSGQVNVIPDANEQILPTADQFMPWAIHISPVPDNMRTDPVHPIAQYLSGQPVDLISQSVGNCSGLDAYLSPLISASKKTDKTKDPTALFTMDMIRSIDIDGPDVFDIGPYGTIAQNLLRIRMRKTTTYGGATAMGVSKIQILDFPDVTTLRSPVGILSPTMMMISMPSLTRLNYGSFPNGQNVFSRRANVLADLDLTSGKKVNGYGYEFGKPGSQMTVAEGSQFPTFFGGPNGDVKDVICLGFSSPDDLIFDTSTAPNAQASLTKSLTSANRIVVFKGTKAAWQSKFSILMTKTIIETDNPHDAFVECMCEK